MKDLLATNQFVSNFHVKTPGCKVEAMERSLLFQELVKFKVNCLFGLIVVLSEF